MHSEKEIIHYDTIISGGYGLYNWGDDALMYTIYKCFEEEFISKKYAFLCEYSPYLNKIVPNATIIDRREERFISCKNFIYGGGTLFYSFKREKISLKRNILNIVREISPKLYSHLLSYKSNGNIKYVPDSYEYKYALGIGIGPFQQGVDDRMIDSIRSLKDCEIIYVRDQASLLQLEEWEITSGKLVTDICFHPEAVKGVTIQSTSISKKKKKIGVIVRDWVHNGKGASYIAPLQNFKEKYKDKYDLQYIVFSKKADKLWLNYFIENNESYLIWDPDSKTILEFMKDLSEFDLFITARFHGFVYAMLLGKLAISISIEPKLGNINNIYPKTTLVWDMPYSTENLNILILKMIAEYDEYTTRIKKEFEKHALIAEYMTRDLKQKLNDR